MSYTIPSVDFSHGDLRVSDNRRFLQHTDGTPFFYLGDTAWELFHRLNREEADLYLENRRAKGFTVIQAVALAELDGLNTPNAYGDNALLDNDPRKPNEAYFHHVDYIVDKAREKGLYIGFLPTWGDKTPTTQNWGTGPIVFNPENGRAYGRFLGERYREVPNIIWVLGGDRIPDGCYEIWREMAAGLTEGDGGRHLKTYHPPGPSSSSFWLHGETWLDFHMNQSGHYAKDIPNYNTVAQGYVLEPAKPCLDGEPRYEDHPINWNPANGYFEAYDARQAAYWGLFAGGCGHTYGCQAMWQFYERKREPVCHPKTDWRTALDLPGAFDMLHVRRLMESRPFLTRIPDQSLIAGGQGLGVDHIQATRSQDGCYAFIYLPTGNPVVVDLGKLSGNKLNAYWFDPREGTCKSIEGMSADRCPGFTLRPAGAAMIGYSCWMTRRGNSPYQVAYSRKSHEHELAPGKCLERLLCRGSKRQ